MKIDESTLVLSVETFTWQDCKRILDGESGRNRPIVVAHVARLAADAGAGRWPLTHQGIAFGPDGKLLDGQHRLAAHVKVQRDLKTVVCRYKLAAAAEEAMLIFDSGKARGTADSLAIGGLMPSDRAKEATAICVQLDLVVGEQNQALLRDRYHLGSVYQAHREAVDWSVNVLPEKKFSAPLRVAFALGYYVDRTKASELAALRAMRIVRAHLAGERPPERLYATEETALWFKERLPGARKDPSQGEWKKTTTVIERVLEVCSDGAPRSVYEIAGRVGSKPSYVYPLLLQLARAGRVRKSPEGYCQA